MGPLISAVCLYKSHAFRFAGKPKDNEEDESPLEKRLKLLIPGFDVTKFRIMLEMIHNGGPNAARAQKEYDRLVEKNKNCKKIPG